jgi:hypothetical protein
MQCARMILGLLLAAGILIAPAAAFTLTYLEVDIRENGDANVSVEYSLSWIERGVVFMKLAHPEEQLRQALAKYSGKEVQVDSVNPSSAHIGVKEFARVTQGQGGTRYTTPGMNFSLAGQQVRGSWYSRFVTVDTSPDVTTI